MGRHAADYLVSALAGDHVQRPQGIRVVAEGNAPKCVHFDGTGERPTYCHNTVARIPALADPEADRRLRIAFGREVTKRILAGEYSKDVPDCADPAGLEEIQHALALV